MFASVTRARWILPCSIRWRMRALSGHVPLPRVRAAGRQRVSRTSGRLRHTTAVTSKLRDEAIAVLTKNHRDGYTVPAIGLYPYQWCWDSGPIALGWAAAGR